MGLPTVSYTGGFTSVALANATDVAGTINVVTKTGLSGTIIVSFGYTFAVAPIVVFCSANSVAATSSGTYYVTSTTTDFTITASSSDTISLNYHVFETQ